MINFILLVPLILKSIKNIIGNIWKSLPDSVVCYLLYQVSSEMSDVSIILSSSCFNLNSGGQLELTCVSFGHPIPDSLLYIV
jgi:hypothetical protein